jgi:tetratricopeptide (TPR) repeat protein
LPSGFDSGFLSDFYAFRDAAYNDQTPANVQIMADALLATTSLASLPSDPRNLLVSRIEFLAGRAWQDGGDKKRAISRFEAARTASKKTGDKVMAAAIIMADTLALSELCLLKDFVFLLANGPSISPNAKKALELNPDNIRARITLASAKAYPPVIWGGDYKAAIVDMLNLIGAHGAGFEKDDLFDIRVCIATAWANLKDKSEARFWFSRALDLFPGNKYANEEMGKLSK